VTAPAPFVFGGLGRPPESRRASIYIDKILEGVRPADLLVERASKYQLVINARIASALGLTIPWCAPTT
jgi:hypothetical protein